MYRNNRYYQMNGNQNNLNKYENDNYEQSCNISSSINNYEDKCGCGFESEKSVFPENPMLAQSYVPIQYMDRTFKPNVGLKMGTIFPELVSPYSPGQSIIENNYIRNSNSTEKRCNNT